jgi:hypothetical protein
MDTINITWMVLGIIAGIGIGYAITTIRINLYLRKYYPDVNFQTPTKERLEFLEKKRTEIAEQDKLMTKSTFERKKKEMNKRKSETDIENKELDNE